MAESATLYPTLSVLIAILLLLILCRYVFVRRLSRIRQAEALPAHEDGSPATRGTTLVVVDPNNTHSVWGIELDRGRSRGGAMPVTRITRMPVVLHPRAAVGGEESNTEEALPRYEERPPAYVKVLERGPPLEQGSSLSPTNATAEGGAVNADGTLPTETIAVPPQAHLTLSPTGTTAILSNVSPSGRPAEDTREASAQIPARSPSLELSEVGTTPMTPQSAGRSTAPVESETATSEGRTQAAPSTNTHPILPDEEPPEYMPSPHFPSTAIPNPPPPAARRSSSSTPRRASSSNTYGGYFDVGPSGALFGRRELQG